MDSLLNTAPRVAVSAPLETGRSPKSGFAWRWLDAPPGCDHRTKRIRKAARDAWPAKLEAAMRKEAPSAAEAVAYVQREDWPGVCRRDIDVVSGVREIWRERLEATVSLDADTPFLLRYHASRTLRIIPWVDLHPLPWSSVVRMRSLPRRIDIRFMKPGIDNMEVDVGAILRRGIDLGMPDAELAERIRTLFADEVNPRLPIPYVVRQPAPETRAILPRSVEAAIKDVLALDAGVKDGAKLLISMPDGPLGMARLIGFDPKAQGAGRSGIEALAILIGLVIESVPAVQPVAILDPHPELTPRFGRPPASVAAVSMEARPSAHGRLEAAERVGAIWAQRGADFLDRRGMDYFDGEPVNAAAIERLKDLLGIS